MPRPRPSWPSAIEAYAALADDWTHEALHAATLAVAEGAERKLGKAQAPIRVAVTGRRVGPPLFEALEVMGPERALDRLRAALRRADVTVTVPGPAPARERPPVGGTRGGGLSPVARSATATRVGPFRRIVQVAGVVLAVVVAYLAVTAVQVWLTGRRYEPRPAGAIVVMGAAQYNGVPSPDLAARLDQAVILWKAALRHPHHGDRLQGAGRPVHRGRGVGPVT